MATENEGSSSSGNNSSERKSINILILGEIGIGKTSLIRSYLHAIDEPIEELDIEELDIFAKYPVHMKYNEIEVDVGLIDMYPGVNSPERRECYPKNVNIILLCFSISEYDTLQSVFNLWVHEVRSHFGKLIPAFLVGLRSDMRAIEPGTPEYTLYRLEENRLVEKTEAESIHKKYNFHGDYMECSIVDKDAVIYVIQQAFLFVMDGYNSV